MIGVFGSDTNEATVGLVKAWRSLGLPVRLVTAPMIGSVSAGDTVLGRLDILPTLEGVEPRGSGVRGRRLRRRRRHARAGRDARRARAERRRRVLGRLRDRRAQRRAGGGRRIGALARTDRQPGRRRAKSAVVY